MRAISIIGPKKSGKTTLGVRLAEELRCRGLRVAAAKSTHHGFDGQDTDTTQYAEHCTGVVGLGPEESFVRWPENKGLTNMLPFVDADILLVEGMKQAGWLPRILVLDAIPQEGLEWLGPELAVAVYGNLDIKGIPPVETVQELADIVEKKAFMLPGLDCGACGRTDCRSLAAAIVADEAKIEDCTSLGADLSVEINGVKLGINPFVQDFTAAAIRALLRQLKGYAPGQAVIKLDV
ncbi:molybdopterin-guanine dinucleotide biosynthesis protein MobB [Salidesulfovibrio onnuriiensis]|uniref:molybdopterin-guanine dinucleotide biosynthesis protein MobB n=1 Tax=Salidesulfovibrio onnuriiensis TaxID=2583823 RepID=UPI0011CADC65|nr:molybdopterin-guanine dinucleotide biosynthesis protein MobB [Salidesulfovibrio onnuriiensis]